VNSGMVDTECVSTSKDRYAVNDVGCMEVDSKLESASVNIGIYEHEARREQFTSDMFVHGTATAVRQLEAVETTGSFENLTNFYEELSAKGKNNVNCNSNARKSQPRYSSLSKSIKYNANNRKLIGVSTPLKRKADVISDSYEFSNKFIHTTQNMDLEPSLPGLNMPGLKLIAEGVVKKRKTEFEAKFRQGDSV
jgi:hypothetical protein